MENTMDRVTNVSIGDLQEKLKVLFKITHSGDQSDLKLIYRKCISEEFNELLDEDSNTHEDFKELCDLIWVCVQYANACGYDIEAGMNELIKEYSSKLWDDEGNFCATYRKDGKLLKGDHFKKANFDKLMKRG
jgi:NTP pyrophosphatase (non-canonical NTP hydrolase)|nr:MAG TPA: MAZG-LIKE NUCLEOSIDE TRIPHOSPHATE PYROPHOSPHOHYDROLASE [Caudoviricetes sp.]